MLWRWNYETHEYDLFPIKPEWHCVTTGDDDDIINCPQCGKEMRLNDGYTSCEIHEQKYGFGYIVCEDCSNKEWERRRKYRDD